MPAAQTFFFLHVPKTGGTTLSGFLRRQVDAEGVFRVDDVDGAADDGLADRLADRRDRGLDSVVVGHFGYGAHHRLGVELPTYLTLLRDPVERVISAYRYVRSLPDEALGPGDLAVKRVPLPTAIAQGLSHNFDNQQVRQLSGVYLDTDVGSCGRRELEQALTNLASFAAVGTVERFRDYEVALGHRFGWDVARPEPAANVTPGAGSSEVAPEVVAAVRRANQLDIELYDRARPMLVPARGPWDRLVQGLGRGLSRFSNRSRTSDVERA